MEEYSKLLETQWAHIDANGHLRNTIYSEFATHVRFSFFTENNFDAQGFKKSEIGPVIVREEVLYYREVGLMETVKVTCELHTSKPDYSKYTFVHYIYKENGKKAAKVISDGIWLDLRTRRPSAPPISIVELCEKLPRSSDFEWK